MNGSADMSEINPGMAGNAVSLYGQSENAYEDFPVLKAFQQYIDAEQEKARKRLIWICAFFAVLMFVVIFVFVILLVNVSSRNQLLNDRLVEYAMKDRETRSGASVVVQPSQDASAVLTLNAKLEDLQKKLAESQAATAKIVSNATAQAQRATIASSTQNGPTSEELEILRLKAQLAAEKKKNDLEREKRRQAELEEYRRKHYPELYEQPKPKSRKASGRRPQVDPDEAHEDLLDEVDKILKGSEPVRYFDEDEDAKEDPAPRTTRKSVKRPSAPTPAPSPEKEYSIPVEIRGSSSRWNVPNE